MDDLYSVFEEPRWFRWIDFTVFFLIGLGFGVIVALYFTSTLRQGNVKQPAAQVQLNSASVKHQATPIQEI